MRSKKKVTNCKCSLFVCTYHSTGKCTNGFFWHFQRNIISPGGIKGVHDKTIFSPHTVELFELLFGKLKPTQVLRLQRGQVRGGVRGPVVPPPPPEGLPRGRVEDAVLKANRRKPQQGLRVSYLSFFLEKSIFF